MSTSTNVSIPLSDVLAVVRDHVTDAGQLAAIQAELLKTQRQIAADKEADKGAPKGKTRLCAIIRGDEALKRAVAGGCYILSVPDPEDDAELANTYMGEGLLGRLYTACRAHNEAPKKRRAKAKRPIKTLPDAMSLLRAKTIKESGSTFSVKQKGTPVEIVVVTSEALPL